MTVPDERLLAEVVREYAAEHRGPRRRDRDRTEVGRVLYAQGMAKWEIAEVLGVHWAQVDDVLAGKAVRP